MGKPDWKYNPMRDGGVSIAAQEDSARETQAQRDKDVVYARDYAAIVAALRSDRYRRTALEDTEWAIAVLKQREGYRRDPTFNDWAFFADQWGFPALLRALARAIDQPEHVTSDVVEHP